MRTALTLIIAPALLTLVVACRTGDKVQNDGPFGDTGALDELDDDGDGFSADEDCDDSDASVNSGATEVCDGVDNDCDGDVDEGVSGTWYGDADGDGYGHPDSAVEGCSQPSGTVSSATDCDDGDADVHPAAIEVCDEVDNDCDGQVDEDVTFTFYSDADGDSFGDPASPQQACELPEDHVANASDCDDEQASVNPDGIEVCNDVDDDCDGVVDNAATDATIWYADSDGDGFGDGAAPTAACEAPSDHVTDSTDCDDSIFDVNPGAVEICNTIDDDCDALVDDDDGDVDLAGAGTWYSDSDSDTYGDAASPVTACTQPSGTVADATDCDDGVTAVNPGATEVCNSIDDDCDGDIDDADGSVDLSTGSTWYDDTDTDGYGDATAGTTACSQPSGTVTDATDCDDTDIDINPGATEACNGTDDDCDGSTSWLEDDGDGDGLLACEAAVWLRTDAATSNSPTVTTSHGSSQAAALLTSAGFAWDTDDLSTVGLSRSWLDNVGLLVIVGRGTDGPLTSTEAQDLADWVDAGGSLLYTGYHPGPDSCDMVDSLPTAFGLVCASSDSANYWSGSATTITSHALTSGVSRVVGSGGEIWTVTSPTTTVVSNGSNPVVTVLSHGAGRVVGVSDEWFMYNAGTGSADISQGDNEQLIDNIWDWLGDLPL